MSAILVFVLLVLTSGNTISATDAKCDLELHTADSNEVEGRYESGDWKISFSAILQNNTIYSSTVATSISVKDNFKLIVRLSFVDSKNRTVPDIEKLVVGAAKELVETTQCNIPRRYNEVYEDLADKLNQCTMDLGLSQLRYSTMYHETIVASALRICSGAGTICTPSLEYVYGNGMFICSEDLEELFPTQVEAGRREMEKIKQLSLERHILAPRNKRWSADCLKYGCLGLEGSDWGCCGDYPGCCKFCNILCFVHDAICTCCTWWWCGGPFCKPDRWC